LLFTITFHNLFPQFARGAGAADPILAMLPC
jgi:hypothetical protein